MRIAIGDCGREETGDSTSFEAPGASGGTINDERREAGGDICSSDRSTSAVNRS